MWQNNLKIAFRAMLKNKGISTINIVGLTAGIAACLLILLFVNHELSYEDWNPNADRIVRPHADIKFGDNDLDMALTGSIVGPDCQRELPEVQAFCRFRMHGSFVVKRNGEGQQNYKEEQVMTVDSSFFQLFPVPVLFGDPNTCLTQPSHMAISRKIAEKYFGQPQLAVGQEMMMDNEEVWTVSAVFEEIPSTTHFKADFLRSMVGNQEVANDPPLWAMSNNFHTYLLLQPGVTFEAFQERFRSFSEEKVAVTAQQLLGMSLEEFRKTGQNVMIHLQKMTDIHLRSDLSFELAPNGSIQYVWIFGAIAFFILLIACINYMNLTTARSTHRAKEIGVRKVLGSRRKALMSQFLSESFLMTFISMILAVSTAYLLLPSFRQLTSREIEFPTSLGAIGLVLLGGTFLISLLAGAYPAFFLSGFRPMQMLRGQVDRAGGSQSGLRSALVIFQFIASTALITGTILVYNQLQYIQNKKLGFQKEQVVLLNDAYGLGNNVEVFKNAMLNQEGVESVSVSSYLPIPSASSNTTFSKTREIRVDNSVNMERWIVDHDYQDALSLELVAGRFFDRASPSDSLAIVLNESAAESFGIAGDPVGKKVYSMQGDFSGTPNPEDFAEYTVIGVVKNFHFASLRETITSLGMLLGDSPGMMAIRYQADRSQEVIAALENNWRQMATGQAFSYEFMDEAFASMYDSEQRFGRIALIFASLAILISCLGLLGLASYIVERRTKEIGIRKVLGASVPSIVTLLSRNFLLLILVAVVVAIPLAWYFMSGWLSNFAYAMDVRWHLFLWPALISVGVAMLTLGYQGIRAALANPVDSLKSE
jgi:putative ABC transport system permease protein